MQYRPLGNSGLNVSVIGLGCEGFVGKDQAFTDRLIGRAMAAGVNCLDIYTSDPELRTRLGRALSGRREEMILQGHLCTDWVDGQYCRTRDAKRVQIAFEELFTCLGTDYIDIGMLHYVDQTEDWTNIQNGPILAYAKALKQAGKIRLIGLSSHDPVAALAAVESGQIDVLMFSVNPCYDLLPADTDIFETEDPNLYKDRLNMDPDRRALYEACARRGVGITVMKAFAGGDLLKADSPAGRALTPIECLHYALTRPGTASVLCGVRTETELEEALRYTEAAEAEKDYAAALASFPSIRFQGHCMYCGHCAPCPAGIQVAEVTRFLNLAKAQGEVPETVREHYLTLSHHGGDCIKCGACESRCPFGVKIMENMQQAKTLFGK